MKDYSGIFPVGSPLHVILHAMYRQSQGKRPVATMTQIPNPLQALRAAEDILLGGLVLRFDLLITVAELRQLVLDIVTNFSKRSQPKHRLKCFVLRDGDELGRVVGFPAAPWMW